MNTLEVILSGRKRRKLTYSSALHTIRTIGHTALLVLAVTLILIGCPDSTGDNNDTTAPASVNTLPNPIDVDGDGLIDISALEQLYNIRYNLSGSSYKSSAADSGMLCGDDAAACSGYELTRDLDFADSNSYASGKINTDWRPTGGDPATATNAGWEPIGSCNDDTTDVGTVGCGDDDDTPFAARFEGNGYTISNLYARNTNNSADAAIGLFSSINNTAAIDTVGIVDAFVYGSGAVGDHIGGLVGLNSGTITTSYAHNSTADGGAGIGDYVGGLVGRNNGNISASYATGSTVNGGAGSHDHVGGLVGFTSFGSSIIAGYASSISNGGMDNHDRVGGLVGGSRGTIIASYASGSTANGDAGSRDRVGGLVGGNGGIIIASYAIDSTAEGGVGTRDEVGGLVGYNFNTIIASYAVGGTANGGANNDNIVGGLVGDGSTSFSITTASYATAAADGGTGSGHSVGSLVGRNTATRHGATYDGTIIASYGFGTTNNVNTAGLSGSSLPSGVIATFQLTAPGTAAATAVATEWNQASSNTAGAWHFGGTTDIPTLRYADYDGDGNTYGCGSASTATIVIPDSVPNGMGGTIDIECGTTLLPGQR